MKVSKNKEKYEVGKVLNIRGIASLIVNEGVAITLNPIKHEVVNFYDHMANARRFIVKHGGWEVPTRRDMESIVISETFKKHFHQKVNTWILTKSEVGGNKFTDYDIRARQFYDDGKDTITESIKPYLIYKLW